MKKGTQLEKEEETFSFLALGGNGGYSQAPGLSAAVHKVLNFNLWKNFSCILGGLGVIESEWAHVEALGGTGRSKRAWPRLCWAGDKNFWPWTGLVLLPKPNQSNILCVWRLAHLPHRGVCGSQEAPQHQGALLVKFALSCWTESGHCWAVLANVSQC